MIDPEDLLTDDILFEVAKVIALTDSIGEGYGYCDKFTRERFDGSCEYKEVAIVVMNRVLTRLGFNNQRESCSFYNDLANR